MTRGRTGMRMRIAERRKVRYRSPFRPFLTRMADGSDVRVPYADPFASNAMNRTAVHPIYGGGDVIDRDMIASLKAQRQLHWGKRSVEDRLSASLDERPSVRLSMV
jgi:hypothetical protein